MSGETPDQARTRRRWITLAEAVAVIGLLIAGLTLYTNWSDKRADRAARAAAAADEKAGKAHFVVRAVASEEGNMLMLLKDDTHSLGDIAVRFPTALGIQPRVEMTGHEIQADWFADPLLKATDGGDDRKTGRLPILLTVEYFAGDEPHRLTGIYDIIWRTEGRMLRGRTLKLEDLRLHRKGGDQKALDAIWAREKPAP
ncbi:hypothetical protein NPJ82_10090 [Sphingomonas sp. NY01]|uniref:hypothetical protein n=1 Tax=Sphingomonas sp. NY01 TaxID=2968057 RepID=UPI00315DBAEF